MAPLRLTTRLRDGNVIEGRLSNDGPGLAAGFRLCGSILVTAAAKAGCRIAWQAGGYFELEPEPADLELAAGESWDFAIGYKNGYDILNQTWGITGAYIRTANGDAIDIAAEPLEFPSYPDPAPAAAAKAPELLLLPTPVSWEPSGGTCDLRKGLRHPAERGPAGEACAALGKRLRLPDIDHRDDGEVELLYAEGPADLPAEGYQLQLEDKQVTLRANDDSGRFYGLASLLQLAVLHDGQVPCGLIEDQPRFAWRGMHLDCVRHFYPPAYLQRLLDFFALLKLNRFHWHLTDDEAFRLEIPGRPELERTWQRGHGLLVPALFGSGRGPHGDVYRRDDIRQVEAAAAANRMQVMPELEVPAHSWALLQALPELRDPADRSGEISVQGYRGNTMNPGQPATWRFLEETIGAIADSFEAPVIHLGCDEMPPGTWTGSPAVAAWMREHKLQDMLDVQEKMMQQVAALVAAQQRRPAAWEEAARGRNGGLGHDAVIFSWTGQGPGLEAARNGYQVVLCPAQHTYMDMAPSADPRERGLNWAALVDIADTLAWEPVPPDEPELAKNILGVQGALWCETVLQPSDCEPMLAPRLLGVAEKAWAQADRTMDATQLRGCAAAWEKLLNRCDWRVWKAAGRP